jgi:hypothetical protein
LTGAFGKSLVDGPLLCEAADFGAPPAAPDLAPDLATPVDDRTAAYISKMQPGFDALRQSVAQLASLLVLASIDGRGRILDPPVLALAIGAHREAEDMLRAEPVPDDAAHHHHHLSLAAERIGEALGIARQRSLRSDAASLDRTIRLLRAGWEEMLSASRALPGFQVVDFNQSCCTLHRRRAPRP